MLIAVGVMLSSCGSGLGGIVTAVTSGGGGGGGARPPISGFSVTDTKTSPCTIAFSLSRSSNVSFRARIDGIDHEISVHDERGATGTSFDLAVAAAPRRFVFRWNYAAEGLGLDESRLTQCVTVFAAVPGLTGPEESTNAAIVSLGNDPPTILEARLQGDPTEDVVGLAAISMTLSDTEGDSLFVRIEYDDGNGQRVLAAPAGLAAGDPRPAEGDGTFLGIRDVPVPRRPGSGCPVSTGVVNVVFLWDVRRDLGARELPVRVRLTPLEKDDGDPERLLEGEPFEDLAFTVDNNAGPVAFVDGASFTLNASDQRRGIPVPFTVQDDEGDVIDLLFQWTRRGEPFPRLEDDEGNLLSTDEVRRLASSASTRERERLRIASEFPVTFEGRLALPVSADGARLPELRGSASFLLGPGGPRLRPLVGRELEILRDPLRPIVSLRAIWSVDPGLARPVGALARGDGRQALVLEDTGGGFRIRMVDLATGEAEPDLATGAGSPTGLFAGPSEDTVLLAIDEDGAGSWAILEVCLDGQGGPAQITLRHRRGPESEAGIVKGLISTGRGAAVLTVASSLILLEADTLETCSPATDGRPLALPDPRGGSRATTLLGPESDPPLESPHGLVLDPGTRRIVYVAETLADRVTAFDLASRERWVVPGTTGLPGPTALAASPEGRLLLVLAGDTVVGVPRASSAGATPVAPAGGSGDPGFAGAVSLAVGPDGLLLLALRDEEDLGVVGGLEQKRRITDHDPARGVVRVSDAFRPPIASGKTWRVQDRASRVKSTSTGVPDAFVWDTRDVRSGGSVLLRAVPIDGDVGQGNSTFVARNVSAPFAGSICRIGSRSSETARVPAETIVVDIDRDGDLDLVSAHDRLDQGLRILRQTSRGELVPENDLGPPGDAAIQVAAGDFNGDGFRDLIGYFAISGMMRIFLQDPETRLLDPLGVEVAQVAEPEGLALADLDEDGRLDFAVSSSQRNNRDVRIFLQEDISAGVFTQSARLGNPMVLENPRRLVAADVDGDLHIDLVVADVGAGGSPPPGGVTIFYGRGKDGFEDGIRIGAVTGAMESPIDVAVGDVDGDGDLDIVAANRGSNSVTMLRQGPRRAFTLDPVILGDSRITETPHRITLGDIDGDGDMDLICACRGSRNVVVFFQSQDGRFDGPPLDLDLGEGSSLDSLAIGDIDGDGLLDAALADSLRREVIVLRSSGPGTFSPLLHRDETTCLEARAGSEAVLGGAGLTDGAVSLSVADLDRDGDLDLVMAHLDAPSATVFFQASPGRFGAAEALDSSDLTSGSRAVATGDLDGDGLVDLAVASDLPSSNRAVLFRQSADRPGTFEQREVLDVGGGRDILDLDIFDVDGDGHTDVILAVADRTPAGPGALRLLFGDGAGSFEAHEVSADESLFADPAAVRATDIDGDGRLDLVSANTRSNTVTVFRQMAARSFALDTILPAVIPLALEVGDLDGDGDIDLVATELGAVAPGVVVFLAEPGGSHRTLRLDELGGPRFPGRSGTPRAVALADLDGDRDLDIVVAVAEAGTGTREDRVLAFLQEGAGRFRTMPVAIGDGGTSIRGPFALRIADVDGDGDLDIVSANLDSDGVVISYGSH
jgi:hypothetical protein